METNYQDLRQQLERYFSGPDTTIGLCGTLGWRYKLQIEKYAKKWPLTPRDEHGLVRDYYIPISRERLSWECAQLAYDTDFAKQLDPLRKEFANFLLAGVAEEEGVRHTPIL